MESTCSEMGCFKTIAPRKRDDWPAKGIWAMHRLKRRGMNDKADSSRTFHLIQTATRNMAVCSDMPCQDAFWPGPGITGK